MAAPAVLIGCHRFPYFKRTIESVLPQLRGRKLIIVLDKAEKESQLHLTKHLNYINQAGVSDIDVFTTPKHLGLGKNMIRARKIVFEEMKYDRAFILEDDLILSEDYFDFTERMMDWAESKWDNIAICQSFQDKRNLGGGPYDIRVDYGHFWGYLQNRWSWDIIKKDLYEFQQKFLGCLYRDRPLEKIQNWKLELSKKKSYYGKIILGQRESEAKKAIDSFFTGQDAITQVSLYRYGLVKLHSCKSKALYIGEKGEHFNRVIFEKQELHKQNPLMKTEKEGEFRLYEL